MPSDSELEMFFIEHRSAFKELANMLSSEPIDIVGVTRNKIMFKEPWRQVSPSAAGMPMSRFKDYQHLMATNDVKKVWRYNDEMLISAGFSGWGFASKGPRLAYVYSLDVPSSRVDSLDDVSATESGKWKTVYRHLDGHWFIKLTL